MSTLAIIVLGAVLFAVSGFGIVAFRAARKSRESVELYRRATDPKRHRLDEDMNRNPQFEEYMRILPTWEVVGVLLGILAMVIAIIWGKT